MDPGLDAQTPEMADYIRDRFVIVPAVDERVIAVVQVGVIGVIFMFALPGDRDKPRSPAERSPAVLHPV